jgi:hypothetical protein
MKILSLGAGVQSTTIALMSARGELPTLDVAIFADTGSEPAAVYRHLAWLQTPGLLPFPIHVVKANGGISLGDGILAAMNGQGGRGSHARPPLFVLNPDGSRGMVRRQCTGDYKIDPIEKEVRRLLGLKTRQRWPKTLMVEQWIGISRDEASRMRDSPRPAVRLRYPLIELGWSRNNCLDWLEAKGYPTPPKSACTFCPFHSDRMWRDLRDNDAAGWREAVAVDRAVRHGFKNLKGTMFLHGSLTPLEDVDLSSPAERGQPNMFENECEGVCGV